MEHPVDNHQDNNPRSGFKSFAFKRFIVAAILIVLVVWALSVGPGMLNQTEPPALTTETSPQHSETENKTPSASGSDPSALTAQTTVNHASSGSPGHASVTGHQADEVPSAGTTQEVKAPRQEQPASDDIKQADSHKVTPDHTPPKAAPGDSTDHSGQTVPGQAPSEAVPGTLPHAPATDAEHTDRPVGVVFVEAVIETLHHELNERFWGWRPNDIVNITDNVNHYQRGVLEVTRRSAVLLSERISRTGTTAAFNTHLENAMNWLMVKADRYWFPSPESKYRESIKELDKYKQGLISGGASFYTRSDNIIPLLASYEDLLGSCDENLVKQKDKDGSTVSYFEADDYFFYAKGVASAMAAILEAIHHDFNQTIKSRHGEGLLHHAIESCRQAAAMDPLLITNGDLDGILANHRAHMAAPISHARFYIGQLIKTLST